MARGGGGVRRGRARTKELARGRKARYIMIIIYARTRGACLCYACAQGDRRSLSRRSGGMCRGDGVCEEFTV